MILFTQSIDAQILYRNNCKRLCLFTRIDSVCMLPQTEESLLQRIVSILSARKERIANWRKLFLKSVKVDINVSLLMLIRIVVEVISQKGKRKTISFVTKKDTKILSFILRTNKRQDKMSTQSSTTESGQAIDYPQKSTIFPN